MFFDTHVHFDPASSDQEVAGVMERARAAGVTRLVAVGHNAAANTAALRLAGRFPDHVRAALGYDRSMAGECPDLVALEHEIMANAAAVAALGEIGLDFHYSPDTKEAQRQLFDEQLAVARRLLLPVIVHSRDADDDTLDLLKSHARQWTGDVARLGVLHCFTGDAAFAARLLDLGMFISFSGIVSFRNADSLRTVARTIPSDRLLIETDSPYLAPVPHRGRVNEPAFLPAVAAVVAQARAVSVEAIAETTFVNATRLFGAAWTGSPRVARPG